MKVVNIIPTYNERENIGRMLDVLLEIAKKNPKYNFATLVVDDNSPDGTGEVVKDYIKKHKNIKLITGPKKGLGYALLRGYKYAMEKMGAEVIIPNDADFQWNPYKIPALLAKIDEGFDVVVASRHIEGGEIEKWSLFRKLNHWFANDFFAGFVAGVKEVKDHTGCFKAIRTKNLKKVPLEKIKIVGFGFQNYILYELSKTGARFAEVGVEFRERKAGKSKIGLNRYFIRDTLEWMKSCLIIRIDRSQQFIKFGTVGFIGFIVNTIGLELFVRLGIRPSVSGMLGAEMAIISNFTLNNIWTFAAKKIVSWKKIPVKFFQFNITSIGAILIQGVTIELGTFIFGGLMNNIFSGAMMPYWGRGGYRFFYVMGVGFGLIWNYFAYTTFIWKTRKSKLFGWLQKRLD